MMLCAFGRAAGRKALVMAVTALGVVACRTLGPGVSSMPNPIAAYLDGAELQAEHEQGANVCQALHDLATLGGDPLRAARYADYQGTPGSWDLPTLLRRHFVPRSAASDVPDGEAFWAVVNDPRVRAVAQTLHARYRCGDGS